MFNGDTMLDVNFDHSYEIKIFIFAMSRVVLALLMGVGVVAHVYRKVNSPNPKWLIYMTNQV